MFTWRACETSWSSYAAESARLRRRFSCAAIAVVCSLARIHRASAFERVLRFEIAWSWAGSFARHSFAGGNP